MADMLVNLLDLPPIGTLEEKLAAQDIVIHRAVAPDMQRVVDFVLTVSTPNAASECAVCFGHSPIGCFVASQGTTLLGYACYGAIAPDFFGPTAVHPDHQGNGIGKALLLRSLIALREQGYVYGIIGGVGPAAFYEKTVGARMIEGSTPGIYRHFLGRRSPS